MTPGASPLSEEFWRAKDLQDEIERVGLPDGWERLDSSARVYYLRTNGRILLYGIRHGWGISWPVEVLRDFSGPRWEATGWIPNGRKDLLGLMKDIDAAMTLGPEWKTHSEEIQ